MIKGKIWEVEDEICGHCAQNYQEECRAYTQARTQTEREARQKGDALCISLRILATVRG